MTWTAFVPHHVALHLRRIAKQDDLEVARSWSELERLVRSSPTNPIVVDPAADGRMNVAAVVDLVRKFPQTPLVTCVTRSPTGLLGAAALSEYGLRPALLDSDISLDQLAENWAASVLGREILCWSERSLATLPLALRFATVDLFERPHRYSSGSDLALACGLSSAALYRHFDKARVGTPKKIVIVAKMAHVYHHLRNSKRSVEQIADLVGLRPRILADYTKDIFGLLPTRLRSYGDAREILQSLLDWLYKPQRSSTRTLAKQSG